MSTIAIIDDDKATLEILSLKLKQQGFSIELAQDGYQGYDLLSEVKVELALVDILMPKLNGIELYKKLLREKQAPKTIFLSNYDHPGYQAEIAELNSCSCYLKADMNLNAIITLVNQRLALQ